MSAFLPPSAHSAVGHATGQPDTRLGPTGIFNQMKSTQDGAHCDDGRPAIKIAAGYIHRFH
jgi:hypothetical protein